MDVRQPLIAISDYIGYARIPRAITRSCRSRMPLIGLLLLCVTCPFAASADIVGFAMTHSIAGTTAGVISKLILSDGSLTPPPALGMLSGSGAGAQVVASPASGFLGASANVLSSILSGSAEQITGRGEAHLIGQFAVQSSTLAIGEVVTIQFGIGTLARAFLEKNNSVEIAQALTSITADAFISLENLTALEKEAFQFGFLPAHPDLGTRLGSSSVASDTGALYQPTEVLFYEIVAPVGATINIDFRADVVSTGKSVAEIDELGNTNAGRVISETSAGMVYGASATPFTEPGPGMASAAVLADEISLVSLSTGLELAGLDNVNEAFLTEHLLAIESSAVPVPGAFVLLLGALPALAWTSRSRRAPTPGRAVYSPV